MPDSPLPSPAPPSPPPYPAKPIRSVKYILIAAFGLILLLAVASVVNSIRLAKPQPVGERPHVSDPSALTTFDMRNLEQERQLKEKEKEPEVPDVASLTPQQNKALGIANTGVPDAKQEVLRRRQDREKRRLDALKSSSVLVDFPEQTGVPAPSEESRQVAQSAIGAGDAANEAAPEQAAEGRNPAVVDVRKELTPWDTYTGKLYRLFEGRDTLEAILLNRINGSFAGPLMAQISLDIYSHDHQKLLIPQGTVLTGEVTAVNSTQQQRLFVAFHRMVMPDGFSVSLDKFTGLNQAGETGLRDLVNHHYLSIFGASLAIGAIGGLSQIGNSYSGIGYDPGMSFRNGVSQQTSNEAMQVLNRFLNQLPTFTVRERSRLRVWLSNDLLLPAADNHTLPGDI